jgi:2'-5' RNA ligase
MDDDLQYLVGIRLPEPWHKIIKEIQVANKSEKWNISLDPHITLLPFGKAICTPDEAETVLQGVAKKFIPFQILVDDVKKFQNSSHTVFAEVRDTHQLSKLHREVVSAGPKVCLLDRELEDRRFHPHITLSNMLKNAEEQNRVIEEIEKIWAPFSFVCDNFSLFRKHPSEKQWTEIKKLLL